jgi:hypothetical protein
LSCILMLAVESSAADISDTGIAVDEVTEQIRAPMTVVDPIATFADLKPGQTYTVRISVCQEEEHQPLAYSEDIVLECPLDAVTDVVARMNYGHLSVSFSPLQGAVSYIINVEGIGSFEHADTTWSRDCGDALPDTVSVVGVSLEGIQSYKSPDISVCCESPVPNVEDRQLDLERDPIHSRSSNPSGCRDGNTNAFFDFGGPPLDSSDSDGDNSEGYQNDAEDDDDQEKHLDNPVELHGKVLPQLPCIN